MNLLSKTKIFLAKFAFRKTSLLLIATFSIFIVILFVYVTQLSQRLVETTALNNGKFFAKALKEFRTLYTSEVIPRARGHGMSVTHDYKEKDDAIPLPATLSMLLGKHIGEDNSGVESRLYSKYPFPWREKENAQIFEDSFAFEAWDHLSENPETTYYKLENYKGRQSLRLATADLMRASCVDCHNTHPQSPKTDWKVGDLRGVLEVTLPLDVATTQTRKGIHGMFSLALLTSGFIVVGLIFLINQFRVREEQALALRDEADKTAKELARSNSELERFAYITSHDLKSPLRAIDTLSAWIMEDAYDVLPEDSKENLRTLKGRVNRMENLVEDLLQFSRIGRKEYDAAEVDVNEMLEEIIELRDPPPGFEVKIESEMPTLRTEKELLRHVFTNLIDNSIKHHDNPSEGAWAKVSCRDLGSFYEFQFLDNGPGIPKELQKKAFQMFQTLKSRDEVEGSGMGLAIIEKAIVTAGGTFTFESDQGRGFKFTFTWLKEAKLS